VGGFDQYLIVTQAMDNGGRSEKAVYSYAQL
jgi:hypothetical protein